ncbi:MAG: hypothetical protein ACJA2P_001937 [Rhodoferax sp.]
MYDIEIIKIKKHHRNPLLMARGLWPGLAPLHAEPLAVG